MGGSGLPFNTLSPNLKARAQAIFMSTSYVLNESHFDEQAVRALSQLPEYYAMQALNDVATTNNLGAVRALAHAFPCAWQAATAAIVASTLTIQKTHVHKQQASRTNR